MKPAKLPKGERARRAKSDRDLVAMIVAAKRAGFDVTTHAKYATFKDERDPWAVEYVTLSFSVRTRWEEADGLLHGDASGTAYEVGEFSCWVERWTGDDTMYSYKGVGIDLGAEVGLPVLERYVAATDDKHPNSAQMRKRAYAWVDELRARSQKFWAEWEAKRLREEQEREDGVRATHARETAGGPPCTCQLCGPAEAQAREGSS